MPHKISVQRIQQFQRGELWCKRLNGAALVRKNILSSCVVWYDRSHVSEPESVVQRDRVAAAIVSRPDCDWLGCEKRRTWQCCSMQRLLHQSSDNDGLVWVGAED